MDVGRYNQQLKAKNFMKKWKQTYNVRPSQPTNCMKFKNINFGDCMSRPQLLKYVIYVIKLIT